MCFPSMTHFTVRTCRFICWGGLALLRFPSPSWATHVAKRLPPSALPVWPMIRPWWSTIPTSCYLQTPLLAHPMWPAWTMWLYLKRNMLENWSLGTKTEGIRGRMHHLPNVLKSRASVSAARFVFKCQVTSTEMGSSDISNPLTRARRTGWMSLIAQQSTGFSSHSKSQIMTSSPKSHHTLICNLNFTPLIMKQIIPYALCTVCLAPITRDPVQLGIARHTLTELNTSSAPVTLHSL